MQKIIVGIGLASLLAGPLVMVFLAVSAFASNRSATLSLEGIKALSAVMPYAAGAGFVIGVGPIAILTVLLREMARRSPEMAHPMLWMGVGFVGGGVIAALLSRAAPDFLFASGVAGAICGLVVWFFAGRPGV